MTGKRRPNCAPPPMGLREEAGEPMVYLGDDGEEPLYPGRVGTTCRVISRVNEHLYPLTIEFEDGRRGICKVEALRTVEP
jgi:hypothetical protein